MKILLTILISGVSALAQAQSLFDEPAQENDIPYASSLDEEAAQAQYAAQVQAAAGGERVYFLQTIDDLQDRVNTLEDQIQYMGNVVSQQQAQISAYQSALELQQQQAADAAEAAEQAAQDKAATAPTVQPQTVTPDQPAQNVSADEAADPATAESH